MKALAYGLELAAALLLLPLARLMRLLGWRPARVTIVGWWGSETVGDVAILGQLLRELADVAPTARPVVVSFDAPLTRRSLGDLRRPDVPALALGLGSAWALVAGRALVFGGGPLMESPSLPLWALRARVARLAGARVVLYATGIGPLRSPRSTRAVTTLLRVATHVALRDAAALAWARGAVPRDDVIQTFDPAFDFVRAEVGPSVTRQPTVALALRTPPARYLGIADASEATDAFVRTMAGALDTVLDREAVALEGIVMHTGHADSDDHALYDALRNQMRHGSRLHVAPGVHTPAQVIAAMQAARAAVTVRFHAMIFALATETPFVAIDYARPTGKVSAAAADVGREADVLTWDTLDTQDLAARIQRTLAAPAGAAPDLAWASAARRDLLRKALH